MDNTRADILIDSRNVLRTYALAAGLGGLALLLWGPVWLLWDIGGLTPRGRLNPEFANFVTARALGLTLVLGAAVAATLANSADPRRRRNGVLWLAVAHALIVAAILLLNQPTFGRGYGGSFFGVLISAPALLGYAWSNADGHTPGESFRATSLFGSARDRSIEPIRSRYEQDIRRAASQEERNRLARDLHDSLKQQIFVIQTAPATAQTRFDDDPGGAKAAIDDVRQAAREALAEMEAMLDGLNAAPLENAGLTEALKKQCEALGFRTGARVECQVGPLPPSDTLPPGTHEAIFRVSQEALANVGRHARASHVTLALAHTGDDLQLVVRDDGAGFDRGAGTGGLGLENMRERAREVGGSVEVAATPGAGTTVRLTVPASVFSDDAWRVHRNQMLLCAGVLLGYLLLRLWTSQTPVESRTLLESPGAVFVVLLTSTMLAVETTAYLRTRPRRGRRP